MIFLNPDPHPLSPTDAEALGEFFNGDVYKTLKTVLRSRMAKNLVAIGDNISENAMDVVRSGALSEGGSDAAGEIGRLVTTLNMLESIHTDLQNKQLPILKTLTLDED